MRFAKQQVWGEIDCAEFVEKARATDAISIVFEEAPSGGPVYESSKLDRSKTCLGRGRPPPRARRSPAPRPTRAPSGSAAGRERGHEGVGRACARGGWGGGKERLQVVVGSTEIQPTIGSRFPSHGPRRIDSREAIARSPPLRLRVHGPYPLDGIRDCSGPAGHCLKHPRGDESYPAR